MTRLRVLLLVLTVALASAATGAAVAVGRTSAGPVAEPDTLADPVTRVIRTYARGPRAQVNGNRGAVSGVDPLLVAVPDDGRRYDAVVEMTFEYFTRGGRRFLATGRVRRTDQVPFVYLASTPTQLTLRAAAAPTTTTVRFVTRGLEGGETYAVEPVVDVGDRAADLVLIRSRRVVLTVDLTPVS